MSSLKKYFVWGSAVVIILLGLYFRFVNITADPLLGYLNAADEGTHSYAARNLYLYHQFRTDGLCFGCIMPIFPFVQLVGLSLIRFGPLGFRFSSLILSIITPLILYFFLRKKIGTGGALMSALLVYVSPFVVTFGRAGMPEMTMLFFSLLAFITFYKTITATRFLFLFAILTGLLSACAFLSKQSAAPLLFVLFFASFGKNWKVLAGVLFAWVIAGISWYFLFLLPNKDILWWNWAATIGGNRPRGMLRSLHYVFEQVRGFIVGQQWWYLPGFFITPIALLLTLRHKKNELQYLLLLWFLFLFLYFILIPAPYGRFFMQAVLPFSMGLGMVFSYATRRLYRYIILLLFFISILFSMGFSYNSFVKNPVFSYQENAKKLYRTIGQKRVQAPLGWTIYQRFNNVAIYGLPINDHSYSDYYKKYGVPDYIVLIPRQISEYKKQLPQLFAKMDKEKLFEGYLVFRVHSRY